MNCKCKFNNHFLIDFTNWHTHKHTHTHTRARARAQRERERELACTQPISTCASFFFPFYQSLLTVSVLKIARNSGGELEADPLVTCVARRSMILWWHWVNCVHKRFLKILFKCRRESLKLKCISHGFRSDGHSPCGRPRCKLTRAAVLWPTCFARTAYSHSLQTNGRAVAIAVDKYYENSSKKIDWQIQWCMKWTILFTFSE